MAVAETLSFRQAAETLHMSQPPLSRTIKELESRLGVQLFSRNTKGVALTEAGEKLVHRARRILRLLEEAESDLASAGGGQDIRLGITNAIEYGRLGEAARRLATRLGRNITIISESSPRLVRMLRAGRLDAALLALPTQAPDVAVHLLREQPMVVALSSRHRLSRRKTLSLEDLADEPMFWFERSRQPAFFDHCQKVFARHGFKPKVLKEPLDHHVLLADVAVGRAIALLPRSFTLLSRRGVAYRPLRQGKELAVGIGLAVRPGTTGLLEALAPLSRAL
jgi:DNA-binding transcriptional LysR family regulator